MKPFIFLHIEKTSATSIRKTVLEPNLRCQGIGSIRGEVRRPSSIQADCCYHGHVAYGVHRILRMQPTYVTMLRDPVDRAVSFYYFIRDLERTDLYDRHRLRDYADSVSIGGFYENPTFANLSTRRLAGLGFDRVYPLLYRDRVFKRRMLAAAKRHLDEMPVFGLQDHFEESKRRFLAFSGGHAVGPDVREKATKSRPSLAEIEELRPGLIERLQRAHDLDAELIAHAQKRFTSRPPVPDEEVLRAGS